MKVSARRLSAAVGLAALLVVSACNGGTLPRGHATYGGGAPSPRTSGASATQPAGPPRLRVTVMPWRLPQPVGREAVVAGHGTSIVVAGGLIAGDQSTGRAYRLDLSTGRTQMLGSLPVPVHDVAGASAATGSFAGEPLLLGGGNSAEQSVVQLLQPDLGWRVVGHLPTARSDLSAVTVGHRVIVLGGYDGGAPALGDVLASDDGRPFTVLGKLALPVRYAAVAAVDGVIWILGGERNGAMVDTVQRFDPTTGKTAIVAHLAAAVGEAVATVIDGRVLLIGGRTGESRFVSSLWWFDPNTLRVTHAGRLPMPLADSAVVGAAGSAYLIGGETPSLSARVIRLSPALR